MSEASDMSRWPAQISLSFEQRAKKTVLYHRQHMGPLRVQKPFYPPDGVCHVYLLHPPGGMAGHDDLTVDVHVAERANALITTPAANKAYRSRGDVTLVRQDFDVMGTLEWLPQGTILFGGSRLSQSTNIHMTSKSKLMAWDIVSLGRPASGDNYASGSYSQVWTVYLDQVPLFRDRQVWCAQDELLKAAWGLGGHTAAGLFLAYPGDGDLVERCRKVIQRLGRVELIVTCIDGLLVIRALSHNLTQLQADFVVLWSEIRKAVAGTVPIHPRIWAT